MKGLYLFAGLFLVFALGCKNATAPSAPATDENGNPPVGAVDDTAGFYVRHVVKDGYTFITHKGDATFDDECVAESGEDISCTIETEEIDLYFNGVTLQYNVPSTLCAYLDFNPFYFYGKPGGTGPTGYTVDTDKNGDIGQDTDNDGEKDIDTFTTCQYDYTADTTPGPNCCEGKNEFTTRTWNGVSYDSASTKTVWGGRAGNCLLGPAMATQSLTKEGFPRSTLSFIDGTGLNKTYEIGAPISTSITGNFWAANFFDPADHAAAPTAGTPSAFAPPSGPPTNPYYTFTCLDRAGEIISRINLSIREWNTKAAFDDRVSSPTNYDVAGTEPSPFDDNSKNFYPYNDRADWKDIEAGTGYPGFD